MGMILWVAAVFVVSSLFLGWIIHRAGMLKEFLSLLFDILIFAVPAISLTVLMILLIQWAAG